MYIHLWHMRASAGWESFLIVAYWKVWCLDIIPVLWFHDLKSVFGFCCGHPCKCLVAGCSDGPREAGDKRQISRSIASRCLMAKQRHVQMTFWWSLHDDRSNYTARDWWRRHVLALYTTDCRNFQFDNLIVITIITVKYVRRIEHEDFEKINQW